MKHFKKKNAHPRHGSTNAYSMGCSSWACRSEIILHPAQRMRSKIGCFYFADIHHDSNSKCNSPQDSFLIGDSEYSSDQVTLCQKTGLSYHKMQSKSIFIENLNGIWSSTVIFQSFVVEVDNDSTVSHQKDSEETITKEGK